MVVCDLVFRLGMGSLYLLIEKHPHLNSLGAQGALSLAGHCFLVHPPAPAAAPKDDL
jgi:hypothetical protein